MITLKINFFAIIRYPTLICDIFVGTFIKVCDKRNDGLVVIWKSEYVSSPKKKKERETEYVPRKKRILEGRRERESSSVSSSDVP